MFRVRLSGRAGNQVKATGDRVLKRFIVEVLSGFDNKSAGKDGVPSIVNVGAGGDDVAPAGVRANTNVLDDEANEEQAQSQDDQTHQAACCLIVGRDGRVLAVSRKTDPRMLGLPGGKVDPGEEPIDAARRELEEETGLTAVGLHQVFSQRDAQGFVTTTFTCEAHGHIDTDEAGVIRWVHPKVLLDPATCPYVGYNTALFQALGWR